MKPGEFALGSTESRAAARAMLDSRERNMRRIEIRSNFRFPHFSGERPFPYGQWQYAGVGTMLCIVAN